MHKRIRLRLGEAERVVTTILTAHRGLLQRIAADMQRHRELAGAALQSWLAQVQPHSRDGDDPVRQVVAATDGSPDAPASGHRAEQPDGPHCASAMGR